MAGEKDPRLKTILTAVVFQRKRQNIKRQDLLFDYPAEGSCYGQGEDRNLFGALVKTEYPKGDWNDVIRYDDVMELAYGFALYFLNRFGS